MTRIASKCSLASRPSSRRPHPHHAFRILLPDRRAFRGRGERHFAGGGSLQRNVPDKQDAASTVHAEALSLNRFSLSEDDTNRKQVLTCEPPQQATPRMPALTCWHALASSLAWLLSGSRLHRSQIGAAEVQVTTGRTDFCTRPRLRPTGAGKSQVTSRSARHFDRGTPDDHLRWALT